MNLRTATLALSTLLCACTSDEGIQDGRNDDLPAGGKADGGYSDAQIAAALRGANTLGERDFRLSVGLTDTAAHNIFSHRVGPDGLADTADDDPFDDVMELDAVDFIGPSTFGALVDFAERKGWIEDLAPMNRLIAPDVSPSARFGSALALAGDTLVVGAVGRDHFHGGIYLFERSGLTWQPAGMLLPPAGTKYFAETLAADGDTIVASAYDDADATHAKHAYVYERSASGWTLAATLSSPDQPTAFGKALALAGDYLAVAENGSNQHHLHVYRRANSSWTETQLLTSPVPETSLARFGDTLALANGILVVSSQHEDLVPGASSLWEGSGAVYVYDLSGTRWQGARRLAPEANTDALYFGWSVATDGERIAVSSGGAGFAFVFERTGDQWTQTARIEDVRGTIALDHDTLAVDTALDGVVEITKTSSGWTRNALYRPAPPDASYGTSLVVLDGLVIGGAWGEGSDTGAVYSN